MTTTTTTTSSYFAVMKRRRVISMRPMTMAIVAHRSDGIAVTLVNKSSINPIIRFHQSCYRRPLCLRPISRSLSTIVVAITLAVSASVVANLHPTWPSSDHETLFDELVDLAIFRPRVPSIPVRIANEQTKPMWRQIQPQVPTTTTTTC